MPRPQHMLCERKRRVEVVVVEVVPVVAVVVVTM